MTKAAPAAAPLPHWPALLTTDLAAAYVSLSEGSFRALAAKMGLRSVDCGGMAVTRWRRADLDALIDRLAPKGVKIDVDAQNANDAPSLDDPGAAAREALARVRRRAR